MCTSLLEGEVFPGTVGEADPNGGPPPGAGGDDGGLTFVDPKARNNTEKSLMRLRAGEMEAMEPPKRAKSSAKAKASKPLRCLSLKRRGS